VAYRFLAFSLKISRFVILKGPRGGVNRLTVLLCLEVPLGHLLPARELVGRHKYEFHPMADLYEVG
jgi:hypothetical protein